MKHKSETFENFNKFKALVEKQSGCSIKTLQSNRGGEFNSNEFNIFCNENGIHKELTTPYTLKQNGVAKLKNRTMVEMARSMMAASGISKEFWTEGIATTMYLLNISPTKAIRNQTLYKAWKGRKPRESHLKIFGFIAYALVTSPHFSKLDKKIRKMHFCWL